MTVGARFALLSGHPAAVRLEKTLQSPLGAGLLAFGEGFRERGIDVLLGESQQAKAPLDPCGAPAPSFGAGTGEIASERGVVDVAPFAKVDECLLDLIGFVAGARHLLRELAFAVGSAGEPG